MEIVLRKALDGWIAFIVLEGQSGLQTDPLVSTHDYSHSIFLHTHTHIHTHMRARARCALARMLVVCQRVLCSPLQAS